MIVAAHPDDETIGCGGTLLKHRSAGDHVHWVIVTDIVKTALSFGISAETRRSEIESVALRYGFEGIHQLGLPAACLEQRSLHELVSALRHVIETVRPDNLLLPFRSDIHSDHRIVFKAAASSCKQFRCPWIRRIAMYETLSESEYAPLLGPDLFHPNTYTDISHWFNEKIEIMKIYSSEVMPDPWPRSPMAIEALARLRGSHIGVSHAESFMMIFERN